MQSIIVMNKKDNVATCIREYGSGDAVDINVSGKSKHIQLIDQIPFGHRIALVHLDAGQQIIKYGEVIGLTSQSIQPGQHVHTHNVESIRARRDVK